MMAAGIKSVLAAALSQLARRALLLAILLACQAVALLAPVRAVWSVLARNGDDAWEIIKAYDRLANASANGDSRETISSRAQRASVERRRWGCILCTLLDRIDKGHCPRAAGV